MGASWEANRHQLRWLQTAFRAAAILLVGEVFYWVLALIAAA
jgi:hypothetical protein